MKTIQSLVYLVLLQTSTGVSATPQQQQQTTTSTTVSTQQQQMPIGGSPSLAPANLGTNAVGFTDSNRGISQLGKKCAVLLSTNP